MPTRLPPPRPTRRRTLTSFAQLKPKPPLTAAHWACLSRPQRCVALAKDAIAQIVCGRFEPSSGYLTLARTYYPKPNDLELPSKDKAAFHSFVTCDVDLAGKSSCYGCAKAALFLAHIRQNDGVSVATHCRNGPQIARALQDSFSPAQSGLIERYYELWPGPGEIGRGAAGDWAEAHRAGGYHQQARRLLLILHNIVVNKGLFIPDDQPALPTHLAKLARRLDRGRAR